MKKGINFEQFKKEWTHYMVYKPSKFDDFEQFTQEQYVIYKDGDLDFTFDDIYTVAEFCEFFYSEADLDTHPYMIKTKHVKGLIDLINRNKLKNN